MATKSGRKGTASVVRGVDLDNGLLVAAATRATPRAAVPLMGMAN